MVTSGRPSFESLVAGMPDIHAGPSSETKAVDTSAAAPTAEPTPSAPTETTSDAADAAPPPEKHAEPAAEAKPDAETEKRLGVISKAEKRFRDEQTAAKAELDVQRADVARLRAEAQGKGASLDELKALAKKNPMAALAKLGIESEEDIEILAKVTYANSKTGKADPRNAQYAAQTAKEREYATKLEALEAKQAELVKTIETQTYEAKLRSAQTKYLDEAVKLVPGADAESDTHFSQFLKTNPEDARADLLELGKKIERDNGGETPPYAELLEAYEKSENERLAKRGWSKERIAAMLKREKPAAAAAPAIAAKKPGATLDPTATGGARATDTSKLTEEQKRQEMLKNMPWKD